MKTMKTFLILAGIGLVALFGYYLTRSLFRPARYLKFVEWMRNPQAHADWSIQAGEQCGDAPFEMPTDGLIGFIWGDSFRLGHSHQGIDIFGGTPAGEVAVYAAYDGYLTRLDDWKSSLIIRIPDDPLQPGRQIWTYYTHMADPDGNSYIVDDFPPGTSEVFVKAGTLLGYQGNYSGTSTRPVGVHLHFSVVKDDGQGKFLNELERSNTLDPSPYFNLPLNSQTNKDTVPVCGATVQP
ncbi:MAG: peptidoglycan LD-endopeptidase LytH [Chloroflexota bacterium]|nr:peptidoglycan LD-endopeptidase LytH [Chloroflexota bacterium]